MENATCQGCFELIRGLAVLFGIFALTSELASCVSNSASPSSQAGVPTRVLPKEVAVVGHLEMRDKTVTIMRSDQGRLYTIQTKDGQIVAELITDKQLQAYDPDLHNLIINGFVDAAWREQHHIPAPQPDE